MSHVLSQVILEFCKKRFGGVTPDLLLAPEEVALLKGQAKRAKRGFYLVLLPVLGALGFGIAYGLIRLRSALDGSAVNPILNDRPMFVGVSFGILGAAAALFLGIAAERVVLRRLLGWSPDLANRYCATVHGWTARRQLVFCLVLWVPVVLLFALMGWNFGDRVDESGVAYATVPWVRHVQPYPSVTAVEMHTPTGARGRTYLLVRFAGGNAWEYSLQGSSATPGSVAAYIAQRTGLPVSDLSP